MLSKSTISAITTSNGRYNQRAADTSFLSIISTPDCEFVRNYRTVSGIAQFFIHPVCDSSYVQPPARTADASRRFVSARSNRTAS